MNTCENCRVLIDESAYNCPLCYTVIDGNSDQAANQKYPIYQSESVNNSRKFLSNLALFLTITIISISVFINLVVHSETLWFLYVAGPALYGLLLIKNTILSSMHTGAKVLIQVIGISLLAFILDFPSGYQKWSVNIAIPSILVTATMLITILIMMKKARWSGYVGYMIIMMFLGFAPLLMYFTGISNIIWTSAGTALYTSLTIIGIFLFANKQLKNNFIRRFHF